MHSLEKRFIYSKPINVYFESTVACDLTCKHCRANAIPRRSPIEINTEEAKKLLRDIKELGSHLIVSGGDPLKREDLFEILLYARQERIPVSVTPTTSPLATYETIKVIKELGINTLGISLDGATKESQDGFRGVEGTFKNSINVLNYARDLDIPVQVNTTCTAETIKEIRGIYNLLTRKFSPPVKRWSIFLLVPTGRGKDLRMPTSEELLSLFDFLYRESKKAPFRITTTQALFYRVYFMMREMKNNKTREEILSRGRSMGWGVRDGNGVLFVSHKGEIYPSGFLPISLGNIRDKNLAEVYGKHKILKALRKPEIFKGRCGTCSFNLICGGSRARAYALTGDFLESDPLCPFDKKIFNNYLLFQDILKNNSTDNEKKDIKGNKNPQG
ncbi:Putative mycofactocin radical SAM maturase MftC [bacterium HR37]|nr:Putative mycofactocin radical SAM maturase MftC [bacterium HR37]